MTLTLPLPVPVAAYFAAEKAADVDALSRCFIEDAVVSDEGETFTGRSAIKAQNAGAHDKYHHTVEPLAVSGGDDETVVIGQVSGDFPGSPVTLQHIFRIKDGKIASLEIR